MKQQQNTIYNDNNKNDVLFIKTPHLPSQFILF